jgi:hypothetical protein
MKRYHWDVVWIFVTGLSIGWLLGLSVSDLVGAVVTALLTIGTGAASVFARLSKADGTGEEDGPRRPRPAGVAALAFGLALGASGGVAARTNELFVERPADFYARWEDTGLTRAEIARRLFDELHPAAGGDRASGGVLYNTTLPTSVCQRLRGVGDDELPELARTQLPDALHGAWSRASNDFRDAAALRRLVNEHCRPAE